MTGTYAVEVVVAEAEVDLASGLLWGAGVAAIGERGLGDGQVCLTSDLPPGGIEAVAAALGGRWAATVVEVEDDGLDGWRPYATVVRVGEHLVVQPPWVAFDAGPDDVVLVIDPGRSFGHGAHPTTRLCVAEIERLVVPGASVLDVGCGSGLLAIAAKRLGAGRVAAIDIAPEAVVATRANAAANSVDLDVSARPLAAVTGRFDLVVANIGAATLIEMAPLLRDRLAEGGTLVLSGVLVGQVDAVLAAFAPRAPADRAEDDGWAVLTLGPPA